jgi:hypothetical protein
MPRYLFMVPASQRLYYHVIVKADNPDDAFSRLQDEYVDIEDDHPMLGVVELDYENAALECCLDEEDPDS